MEENFSFVVTLGYFDQILGMRDDIVFIAGSYDEAERFAQDLGKQIEKEVAEYATQRPDLFVSDETEILITRVDNHPVSHHEAYISNVIQRCKYSKKGA